MEVKVEEATRATDQETVTGHKHPEVVTTTKTEEETTRTSTTGPATDSVAETWTAAGSQNLLAEEVDLAVEEEAVVASNGTKADPTPETAVPSSILVQQSHSNRSATQTKVLSKRLSSILTNTK